MKELILSNIENPAQLESLYRGDKSGFKRAFNEVYDDVKGNSLAVFWHERLNFEREEISWGSRTDLMFVIAAALIGGFIAKFPVIFHINEEFFFPRNIGFIVFPVLAAYFAWKNQLSAVKIAGMAVAIIAGAIFINFLPDEKSSDTTILSCIHLVLFLWAILGFSFVGSTQNDDSRRLSYLKYNGDLVVMTTLILIAGGIMTGVTIGLFELIGIKIEKFYFEYVVVFALPAAPMLGTYLTRTNPQLVGKVSPVIAKIFSPLVAVMLVVYLVAIVYSGKDPYNDREFLLIFNALLVGVMAIIFFSVAETSRAGKRGAEAWVLFFLSAITVVVNGIALSAILFRISEWGITPNRAAVLGSNVLILINLILVTAQLYKAISHKGDVARAASAITRYLPVYVIWTIVVTFLFPLIFGFK